MIAAVGIAIGLQGILFQIIEPGSLSKWLMIAGGLVVVGGLHVELRSVPAWALAKLMQIHKSVTSHSGRLAAKWAKEYEEGEERYQRAVAQAERKETEDVVNPIIVSESPISAPVQPSATAVDLWHVSRNGQQIFVVSFNTLTRLAENGQVLPADLLWQPGHSHWRPASSVPGVFSALIPTVSPRRRAEERHEVPTDSHRAAIVWIVIAVVALGAFLVYQHNQEQVARMEANRQLLVQVGRRSDSTSSAKDDYRPTPEELRLVDAFDREYGALKEPILEDALTGEQIKEAEVIVKAIREKVIEKHAEFHRLQPASFRKVVAKVWAFKYHREPMSEAQREDWFRRTY